MNSVHTSAFSSSSALKSVFEELRFRDGLMWLEGLTGGKKLRFQMGSNPSLYHARETKRWDS